MRDEDKTKEQLIKELEELRKQRAESQTSDDIHHLREKELMTQQMEFILGVTKTGLDIIDSAFNIRYIDPEWKKLYGDPTGRKCYEYFMDRSEVCPGCGIVRALKTKTVMVTEEVLVKENSRPIQVTTIPFKDTHGEWLVAEVNVDITERKKMEHELHAYRESLEKLVKDRTAALVKVNEKLEKEITERNQAEEELKSIRDHLNNLIESSLDCIMVSDKTGYMTKVNKYFLRLLGFREEEVIGKHVMEFTPMIAGGTFNSTTGEQVQIGDEYIDDAKTMIARLLTEGKVTNWEAYYFRKDKSVVPVEQNIVCLYDKEGERTGAVAIIRDITERKKVEKKMWEVKDFLEHVFKTSVDGIMVTDARGCITMVNEALERLIGYSRDELLGKHTVILGPQDETYHERGKHFIEKLYSEGIVTEFGLAWLKKDGTQIDVEVNAALLKDRHGSITGAVSSLRDVTERKKAEEALRKSEEKYRNLVENANDAIISADKDGVIIDFNKKAEEMFGYPCGEILGKPIVVLSPLGVRDRQIKLLEEFKAKRGLYIIGETLEGKGLRKNGQEFYLEGSSFMFALEGETILTVIIRDISERKKMEEKFIQSEKLRALGELAGGVAHDFNNVLAAILGRVQLVMMRLAPPPGKPEKRKSMLELKESLKIIERAALDGAETVRRIQEFARIPQGDSNQYFNSVDINEIIQHVLEFTRVRWKDNAEAKGILFKIQKSLPHLPPVAGNASELREVFINLINNALDAMPEGGSIKVRSLRDDDQVVVQMEDTGGGIPRALQDRIFDPFFTTKGPQSSGLGLSVSYGIINRHRGTIAVDSREGQGTTFSISLPIFDEVVERREKERPQVSIQGKAKILVIEDEEEVRKLLAAILTENGHEVEVAFDGLQGIELFERQRFDLVLTDLGMPGLSGWQVAKKVKSIDEKVPVALITGWNVKLDESEMRRSSVDLVIQKPFQVNQVIRLVEEGMILRDRFKDAYNS